MKRFFRNLWRKITGQTRRHEEDVRRTVSDGDEVNTDHPTNYRVWIPFAENIHKTEGIKMPHSHEYRRGYLEGLVVHWTSGWQLKRGFWPFSFPTRTPEAQRAKLEKMAREYALTTAKDGAKNGYNFLVMCVFGELYQSRALSYSGSHAGKSYWPSVGYNVSKRFGGVEMLNPGKLKEKRVNGEKTYWTCFGLEIPARFVRYSEGEGNIEKGFYCTYTAEQEESLKNLGVWLKENSPVYKDKKVFNIEDIVGHDEVSPGRKSDPGTSLSMTMATLRTVIMNKYKAANL